MILWILGYLASITASILATIAYEQARARRGSKQIRCLLRLNRKRILFVLPPRYQGPNDILPRFAIEDFLAMHNILRALAEASIQPEYKVCDPDHIPENERNEHDIVTIGSSRVNSMTARVLAGAPLNGLFQFEPRPDNDKHLRLRKNDSPLWESASYAKDSDPQDVERLDFALIARVKSPWNIERTAIVIAGIRGIGTWGAAEIIRKRPADLALPLASAPTNGFAAVVKVRYKNYNIQATTVDMFTELT
jgi:hypothetical protein